MGEQHRISGIPVGEPEVGIQVVLPVMGPVEGGDAGRSGHLEGGVRALHEHHEARRRVHSPEIDGVGLHANFHPAADEGGLQIAAGVGRRLAVADHRALTVISTGSGNVGRRGMPGDECGAGSRDRHGQLGSRGSQPDQVDIAGVIHPWDALNDCAGLVRSFDCHSQRVILERHVDVGVDVDTSAGQASSKQSLVRHRWQEPTKQRTDPILRAGVAPNRHGDRRAWRVGVDRHDIDVMPGTGEYMMLDEGLVIAVESVSSDQTDVH